MLFMATLVLSPYHIFVHDAPNCAKQESDEIYNNHVIIKALAIEDLPCMDWNLGKNLKMYSI